MNSSMSNRVLAGRVRQCVRPLLRPPWRVSVTARDGRVRLSGPLLPEEIARVLDAVVHIEGVSRVEHHLGPPHRNRALDPSCLKTLRPRLQLWRTQELS
jgi:hypothetical protein